jgi:hypothetical protein
LQRLGVVACGVRHIFAAALQQLAAPLHRPHHHRDKQPKTTVVRAFDNTRVSLPPLKVMKSVEIQSASPGMEIWK